MDEQAVVAHDYRYHTIVKLNAGYMILLPALLGDGSGKRTLGNYVRSIVDATNWVDVGERTMPLTDEQNDAFHHAFATLPTEAEFVLLIRIPSDGKTDLWSNLPEKMRQAMLAGAAEVTGGPKEN